MENDIEVQLILDLKIMNQLHEISKKRNIDIHEVINDILEFDMYESSKSKILQKKVDKWIICIDQKINQIENFKILEQLYIEDYKKGL